MTSSAFVERHAGNCLDNKFLQFKAEQKEKVMKRGWQVFSIGVLSLFSFGVWESSKLSLIDKLGPGPGFFGFWLSVIGIALSCVLLLEVTRRTDAKWSSLEVLPGKSRALADPFHRCPDHIRDCSVRAARLSTDHPAVYGHHVVRLGHPVAVHVGGHAGGRELRRLPRFLLLAESAATHRYVRNLRRVRWKP